MVEGFICWRYGVLRVWQTCNKGIIRRKIQRQRYRFIKVGWIKIITKSHQRVDAADLRVIKSSAEMIQGTGEAGQVRFVKLFQCIVGYGQKNSRETVKKC